MTDYIYLLQEREFIKTKENIYKLGKSKQENLKRIQNYPNGTKLIIQLECENCDIAEKNLIIIFKKKFIQRNDIGTEYFEGYPYEMRKIICDTIVYGEKKNEDKYLIFFRIVLYKIMKVILVLISTVIILIIHCQ